MRHGQAVDAEAGGYAHDSERPLADEGRREVTEVAAGLRHLGLTFDLVLTSPLVRARQTADLLAQSLTVTRDPIVCPALEPAGDLAGVLAAVQPGERVLAVGHMPLLGELVGWLVWGDPAFGVPFRTAGLCRVDLEARGRPGDGRLEWLLPPRLARRLG
jgi:phosphohistidine phosphatase